jgi:hypothetical protein
MNRRSVLRLSTIAGMGIVFPNMRIAAQKTSAPSPEMSGLSVYMTEAARRALPAEVAEHAKHHILDTFAAMISGSELGPGQAALRYVRVHAGKGTATIAGSNLTAGPVDAALANGVMAHADETDDSHARSRSHPGCAVVPAALAAGEEFGIDGARFLRAVTLGYDVGTRVTIAMGGVSFSYESHKSTHSIAGVFGAAAAAACAAGLDAQQMRWVLDYTAQQSSGIAAWRRDTDHIEKAFVFGGMPARSGVTSALWVQSGWNGVGDIARSGGGHSSIAAPAPNRLRDPCEPALCQAGRGRDRARVPVDREFLKITMSNASPPKRACLAQERASPPGGRVSRRRAFFASRFGDKIQNVRIPAKSPACSWR